MLREEQATTVAESASENVTRLLREAADGGASAATELLPLVYDELRSLAAGYFLDERSNHTLQPTALVHEAYMRLVQQPSIQWESRRQFFFLASRAMRNILVDHARGKKRVKRGGDRGRVDFSHAADVVAGQEQPNLVAIDEALQQLAALDARKAQLVELRFFGGLSADDAAEVLGIARSTAAEEWRMARAWLALKLKDDRP